MKRRMPLQTLIIVTALMEIVVLIETWFDCNVWIYVISLYTLIPLVIGFFVSLVLSLIHIIKCHKKVLDFVPLLILGCMIITTKHTHEITNMRINLEMLLYGNQRMEMVNDIKNDGIYSDEREVITLPIEYRHISSNGNMVVYQDTKDKTVIGFLDFGGLNSGYDEIVYTSDNSVDTASDIAIKTIRVNKLKENWFWVETES